MPAKKDYDVGYGKPPKHTQFKPGQSPHPGRKAGNKNLETHLREVLAEKLKLGGKTISKQRALIVRLTTDALNGKQAAMNKLLDLMLQFGMFGELEKAAVSELLDEAAMQRAVKRYAAKAEAAAQPSEESDDGDSTPNTETTEEEEDWLK